MAMQRRRADQGVRRLLRFTTDAASTSSNPSTGGVTPQPVTLNTVASVDLLANSVDLLAKGVKDVKGQVTEMKGQLNAIQKLVTPTFAEVVDRWAVRVGSFLTVLAAVFVTVMLVLMYRKM